MSIPAAKIGCGAKLYMMQVNSPRPARAIPLTKPIRTQCYNACRVAACKVAKSILDDHSHTPHALQPISNNFHSWTVRRRVVETRAYGRVQFTRDSHQLQVRKPQCRVARAFADSSLHLSC